MTTEFTSERLEFRTWTGAEEKRLQAIMTDDEMPAFWRHRWIGDGTRKFIAFQQEIYRQSKLCYWALWHKAENRLVGFCGLVPMIETGETEIGWALAAPYWKRGLATEACRRVIAYAKWRGHDKLVMLTQPGNEASMRLAERVGMTKEGEIEWHGTTGVRYVMALGNVVPIGREPDRCS